MTAAIVPRRCLSAAEKGILAAIIAENPALSAAEVRDAMFGRTGRLMAVASVWPYMPRKDGRAVVSRPGGGGFRLGPPDRSGWFADLPARQRDALLRLMDAHPEKEAIEVVAMLAKEVAS